MLLHIPHSSTKMIDSVKVPNLDKNIGMLTDWYVNELFDYPGERAEKVVFPYSRLVVDVERFKDDVMEYAGKGYLYQSDVNLNKIIRDRDIGEQIYDEYHYSLNTLVNQYFTLFPVLVIVDCHSFNPTPLPWEDSSLYRPDICIGTDFGHTPIDLSKLVFHYFVDKGYSTLINEPYFGSIVPSQSVSSENLFTIMIEVNKGLYLNTEYKKTSNFNKVKEDITGALDIIYEWQEKKRYSIDGYL